VEVGGGEREKEEREEVERRGERFSSGLRFSVFRTISRAKKGKFQLTGRGQGGAAEDAGHAAHEGRLAAA